MMDSKGSLATDVPIDFLTSLLGTILPIDTYSARFARSIDFLSKAICVLAFWRIVENPDRASVLERPTQSSILGLFGAGFVLSAISLALRQPARRDTSEEEIHLVGGDDDDGISSRSRSASLSAPDRISWARQPLRFTLVAVAIMVRLQAFEAVLRNLQCRIVGIEAFVPIFVVIFDHYPVGPSKYAALGNLPPLQRLFRALVPALMVSWANNLIWRVASYPRSTVICPATTGTTRWVVQMQLVGVVADAWILHSVQLILAAIRSRASAPAKRAPLILGMLFMTSSGLIFTVGLMTAILPRYRAILSNLNYHYLNNLSWSTFLFVLICLFASHWVAEHPSTDLVVLLSLGASGLQVWSGWDNAANSPAPKLQLPSLPPLLLLLFGASVYFYATRHTALFDTASRSRYYRSGLIVLGAGVICVTIFRGVFGPSNEILQTHPIDTLIEKATAIHDRWAEQASRSTTLQEAVETYIQRYGRHPPPGFDRWYKFAVSRKAYVIDDFDAIDENLRLFWKLEPRALRWRTKYLMQDEHHDCAEVSIRDGKATIGTVIATHKWMVEGIIHMMEPFVKELPDMDLAFNINDEPRVAIPYETIQALEKLPSEPENAAKLKNEWSSGRGKTWEIPEGEISKPLDMTFFSFKRVWRLWGSVACPPDSPAWRTHFWDSTVTCTSCYEPHSFQHFLSNWTLAASPCHQPDIANLHGFYMSPSAFNPTHEVIPIFSQSRAGGFADILYPTAWNYNDKVKLAPSDQFPDDDFESKQNTIFWRGTATEGFSKIGSWRGQVRPRMVHLANNSSMVSNILLKQDGGYKYAKLSTSQFLQHPTMKSANFTTSLGFVDRFNRCGNGDCEVQEAALGLGKGTDFQYHWRHRFLLDADGAGFSGRFLPFLQSHSVPFKTAIFREWYDSRLTPWKHFVPVDIRLHSLWSTTAYFAGGFGKKPNGHDPAKTIAEEGREWAAKVLRKEDMEIYFYRLLLEYARVMDDDRANLGYVWKSDGH